MGANTDFRHYPDTLDKTTILKQWGAACEESRYESGHSYSGAIGMLNGVPTFEDKEFLTEREADDYIADNHEKWRAPMAVSYKDKGGAKWWLIGGWCSS